tara:strand:- start:141 stop:548 length:408 start_codon:yes stop_codon:yes gene_type:complete
MLSNKIDIRVYYEDTDAGGIVYYSNYLKYTERCRTELLRKIGITQTDLSKQHNIKFIVHSLSIRYINPAFLDNLLTVETTICALKKASIEFSQRIFRKDVNTKIDIIESKCKIVSIDNGNNIMPIPEIILKEFSK